MKYPNYFTGLLLMISVTVGSCTKELEVDTPIDQLTIPAVFSDGKSIDAVMAGLYSYTFRTSALYVYYIDFFAGMSADETTFWSASYNDFKNNALTGQTSIVRFFWTQPYQVIYQCNSIIANLEKTTVITAQLKEKYIAEAKFIRGLSHFILTNYFGDVPLVLTTDAQANALLPRSSRADIYQAVIEDLQEAETTLEVTTVRTRLSKQAASALLARVYLYKEDWTNAAIKATEVINSPGLRLESNLNNVFIRGSRESIFQASSSNPGGQFHNYLSVGNAMVPSNTTSIPLLYIRTELLNAFETGDNRKANWTKPLTVGGVTYYSPNKYKLRATPTDANLAEDYVLLRLGEQYLIRAEARAQLDQLEEAASDVDSIRLRAGLPAVSGNPDKAALLLIIEQERRIELMVEWGHRWMDLIRTKRADAVLGAIKPTWKNTAVHYPVPNKELETNPNLLPQTLGY